MHLKTKRSFTLHKLLTDGKFRLNEHSRSSVWRIKMIKRSKAPLTKSECHLCQGCSQWHSACLASIKLGSIPSTKKKIEYYLWLPLFSAGHKPCTSLFFLFTLLSFISHSKLTPSVCKPFHGEGKTEAQGMELSGGSKEVKAFVLLSPCFWGQRGNCSQLQRTAQATRGKDKPLSVCYSVCRLPALGQE